MADKKGAITVIKTYFGFREGQTLLGFRDEVKALSEAEKLELAQGAARNLGLTRDEVDFPLA
ncbi:hypothetical protein L0Y49_01775 [bacterium]|nr:hypothetical protein [bacterium]MCI0565602.1 hypothetical protein [bacterium]MCI0680424.1 hypothetical protein [bacterium]